MELNEEIRRKILANADAGDLTETARAQGMRTLAENGWEKVRAGVTSPEEVLRVTQAL
jgi:type IV pilus assembly protein PilB